MSNWIEVLPDEIAIDFDMIGVMELDKDEIKFDVQGKEVKVDYPDDPTALAAYQAYLAILLPDIPPIDQLHEGDVVRYAYQTDGGDSHIRHRPVTVVAIPRGPDDPWVFNDGQRDVYIYEPITVFKE